LKTLGQTRIPAREKQTIFLLGVDQKDGGGNRRLCGTTQYSYAFSIGARAFIDEWCHAGPSHHCAIGVGHIASKLEKLAALKQIEFLQVC